jgi:hypothetical protein
MGTFVENQPTLKLITLYFSENLSYQNLSVYEDSYRTRRCIKIIIRSRIKTCILLLSFQGGKGKKIVQTK